jgi:hypothetical protein
LAHHVAESDPENAYMHLVGPFEKGKGEQIPTGCPSFDTASPVPTSSFMWFKAPHKVAVYTDFNAATLSRMDETLSKCREYKMVHIVKDPVEAIADGYGHLVNSQNKDLQDKGLTVKTSRDLRKGLRLYMETVVEDTHSVPEMADVSALLYDRPNVLTVGAEEFDKDFAGTVDRVYTFLLGEDYPKMKQLKEKASHYDFSQWSTPNLQRKFNSKVTTVNTDPYYRHDKIEATVKEMMKEPEKYPLMSKVKSMREKMHYTGRF